MSKDLIAQLKTHSVFALFALALTALICAVPFFQPYQDGLIPSFGVEIGSIVLGLLISTLLFQPAVWRPFHFPAIAMLPIALILVLALQVGFGLMSYWQQHALIALYLFWGCVMMLVATQIRKAFGLDVIVPVLAWAILIAGMVVAVITITKPISASLGMHDAVSELAQHANYLALSIASLFYLLHTKRLAILAALMVGTLLLLALAVTHQFLSWVYLAILSCQIWFSGQSSMSKWQVLWLVAVFIIWQTLVPQISIQGNPLFSKPVNTSALSLYWQYSQEAWQIFLNYPLLGAGWGQFGWQDFLFAEAFPQHTGVLKHPHNFLLQLLAETGLVGTTVLVVCSVLLIRRILSVRVNAERRWLYTVLGLLSVLALFEGALNYVHILTLLAIILGLLETRVYQIQLTLGQMIARLMVVFVAFALYQLNAQYSKLQYWYAQTDFERISEKQARPMLLQMGKLRHQSLLTPYIDLAIVHTLPSQPAFISDKLSLNTTLMQYSPKATEVYNQAELLALSGKTQEAKLQLQLALIRHPDYLYDFTMQLLKNQSKATLPLLHMIVKHNQKYLESQKSKKSQK